MKGIEKVMSTTKIEIKTEGLSQAEERELHNSVRKIMRKRRIRREEMDYELRFEKKKYVPRNKYNEAQKVEN